VDFMPYEGAPLESGHDLKHSLLALSIGAAILVGAWAVAAFTPVSTTSSVSEARMIARSTKVL
jgi:hypothetical protein